MKKKLVTVFIAAMLLVAVLEGCSSHTKIGGAWDRESYDLALPNLSGEEWYATLVDEFDGDKLNENIWTYSPHRLRWESNHKDKANQNNYWCPAMVRVKGGNVEISSYEATDNKCPTGSCPSTGRFSGGFETRRVTGDDQTSDTGNNDELLFSQAFGYFETRVKFPDADGLWSAFWLQASNMRNILNSGMDGTEIDVFESAFRKYSKSKNSSYMGHALLWDGYGKSGKVDGYITKLEQNLYDGYHTFALKWMPSGYVFYIDGVATWASRGGDVSRVREFLRFTVEMDAGDGYGPHGMKIGKFNASEKPVFYVDYIKVYQNKQYEKHIIDDVVFPMQKD